MLPDGTLTFHANGTNLNRAPRAVHYRIDTANMTEVELSEEQEDFLNWLKTSDVRHVRVVG